MSDSEIKLKDMSKAFLVIIACAPVIVIGIVLIASSKVDVSNHDLGTEVREESLSPGKIAVEGQSQSRSQSSRAQPRYLSTSEVNRSLDNVERDLVDAVRGRHVNLDRVERELDVLERDARRKLEHVNRRPTQSGYSLHERRELAYRLLRRQGYSDHEARLTVSDMERHGLLPDPPRRY